MIIVSQDKMRITESLNLEITKSESYVGSFPNIRTVASFQISDTNIEPLGEYKTEERAREVLQEIIKKYGEYGQIINPKTGIEGIYAIPKIYEMPEE